MAKFVANKLSVAEQVFIAIALLLIGIAVSAFAGGWIADNWDGTQAEIICKTVLYIGGVILMWVVFAYEAWTRVFKF